jgi:GH25 family lysozyme M1 (1,4-beta-N-acetylmuramidase)
MTISLAASAQSIDRSAFNHAMGSQIRLHEGGAHDVRPERGRSSTVPGMDVSSYQGTVDWTTAYADGARFAFIKATESTDYINPDFAAQYNGAYDVGMIRGAYHFAIPGSTSTGAAQATYFIAHGGGWSADGQTIPGALDLEYNPYGADCYGLSQSAMASWISSFVTTYLAAEGRYPVIYSSTSWWSECVGTAGTFSSDPLWIARYASTVGTLPNGWTIYSFWQYDDAGTFPGDQDLFNGSLSSLRSLATG